MLKLALPVVLPLSDTGCASAADAIMRYCSPFDTRRWSLRLASKRGIRPFQWSSLAGKPGLDRRNPTRRRSLPAAQTPHGRAALSSRDMRLTYIQPRRAPTSVRRGVWLIRRRHAKKISYSLAPSGSIGGALGSVGLSTGSGAALASISWRCPAYRAGTLAKHSVRGCRGKSRCFSSGQITARRSGAATKKWRWV